MRSVDEVREVEVRLEPLPDVASRPVLPLPEVMPVRLPDVFALFDAADVRELPSRTLISP